MIGILDIHPRHSVFFSSFFLNRTLMQGMEGGFESNPQSPGSQLLRSDKGERLERPFLASQGDDNKKVCPHRKNSDDAL